MLGDIKAHDIVLEQLRPMTSGESGNFVYEGIRFLRGDETGGLNRIQQNPKFWDIKAAVNYEVPVGDSSGVQDFIPEVV